MQVTSKVVSFISEAAPAPCGKDLRPYLLLLWHPLPRHTNKQDVRSRTAGHDVRSDCCTQRKLHICVVIVGVSPDMGGTCTCLGRYHVSCADRNTI